MTETFGSILLREIRERGWNPKEFSQLTKIKKNYLDSITSDQDYPGNRTLETISKALGMHIEDVKSWGEAEELKVKSKPKSTGPKIVKIDLSKPKYPLKAKGRHCIRCFFDEQIYVYDNIQMCHYTGIRQHAFKKSLSKKGSIILECPFCNPCHKHFDEPKVRKSIELSEDFLFFIGLFLAQEHEAGNIIIKPQEG